MNILITGAKGFAGKNLVAALENIKEGKDRRFPELKIDEIFSFDVDSDISLLDEYCSKADFVFNLAGVNRPENTGEFMKGNRDFLSRLLDELKKSGNTCPVMLSSSIQATLEGRFKDSDYGKSKKAAEDLLFSYAQQNDVKALVYRFPNLFGKWARPNYNSAVATFCYNTARDLPINVNDESTLLTLCYIDDVVEEMICALMGKEHRSRENEKFCAVTVEHKVTLGEIVSLLKTFRSFSENSIMPEIPEGSFETKLFSTYLSYLPEDKAVITYKPSADNRGSFTELIKSEKCGQISVNVSLPGITKGEHWHHSKWEIFIVVHGEARIDMRKVGSEEIISYTVSGDKPQGIYMLPGYTHRIVNLSDKDKLGTLMWASERFDPERPDTFFEKVN